jgi:hypothetical protein
LAPSGLKNLISEPRPINDPISEEGCLLRAVFFETFSFEDISFEAAYFVFRPSSFDAALPSNLPSSKLPPAIVGYTI